MADNFLHDESGVNSIVNEIKEYISDYNSHISALENLANTISSSSGWQDESVKTSFVNTLTSYIAGYKAFSSGISGYVECLKAKSENVVEHESNFS